MSSRICGFCGGKLEWSTGEEESARERAGNARYRDDFRCGGCRREFRHWVSERFSGDTEGWYLHADGDWQDLPADKWPR